MKEELINNELIPYVDALSLRDIGFNEPCFESRWKSTTPSLESKLKDVTDDMYVNIPTYRQAAKWLLKKYYLYGIIIPTITTNWTFKTTTVVEGVVEVPPYKHVESTDYSTHDEAELECLRELIKIAKTNKIIN